MKILVLNYEFPPIGGGAAPVSRDIAIKLKERGHEVTVVTMGFQDLPLCETIEGVKIHRVKCWRSKKSSCMPWEQYTYILAAKKILKKHLETYNYDICHVHFVIPTGVVGKWLRKKYRIPYIITAHGSDVEGYNQKTYMKVMHVLLRPFWRNIVRQSEGVIAPSRYLLGLMQKELSSGNYPLIPNGLDVDTYTKLHKPVNKKEPRILLMGRMQKAKNMQTVLKALSLVDLKEWKVDILGDGPYKEELQSLVRELKLEDKVVFHGWINNHSSEQMAFLEKAAIYITASHFENCPMAVLETIAAGCYPLLSDIPAHRQFIVDDKYFFPMDDCNELAKRIQTLIDGGNDWYRGKSKIDVSCYDWSNIITLYEDILMSASKK